MICPRCMLEDVVQVGDHYICNTCFDENGNKTQFRIVYDEEIQFPYNVIFHDRPKKQFFRKPYLVVDRRG